jgi:SAM-dependent methyltransferase
MPGGRVLVSDFAEAMVDGARRRAEAAGIEDIEFAVLDAQDLTLSDASFDVALCGFGLMLMPDPVKAASEIGRVLRPGGRLVAVVWADEAANPWLAVAFRAVMDELGAPDPPPGTPGPFALGEGDRLRDVLREGGFDDPVVERVALEEPHESFDSWWSTIETSAGPMVAVLNALTDEQREAVRARARDAVSPYATESGSLVFPTAFIGARAQVQAPT